MYTSGTISLALTHELFKFFIFSLLFEHVYNQFTPELQRIKRDEYFSRIDIARTSGTMSLALTDELFNF